MNPQTDTPETPLDRLGTLFCEAFPTNLHDYALVAMELKRLRALAAATEEKDKEIADTKAAVSRVGCKNADDLANRYLEEMRRSNEKDMPPGFDSWESYHRSITEQRSKLTEFGACCRNVEPGEHGEGVEVPATPESIKATIAYLQKEWDGAEERIAELERENRELNEDKARLDWMNEHRASIDVADEEPCGIKSLASSDDYEIDVFTQNYDIREAIDAARNV